MAEQQPGPPTLKELICSGRQAYDLAHLAAGGTGPDAARAGEQAFAVAILERLALACDEGCFPCGQWEDVIDSSDLRAIAAQVGGC